MAPGPAQPACPLSNKHYQQSHLIHTSHRHPQPVLEARHRHHYPAAPHAFHADYRPSFRKEAAEDGWKRCMAWFKAHGVA